MNFISFAISAILLLLSANIKADIIDTLGQPPIITEIDTTLCPGDLLYGIYDVPGTYIDTFAIDGCDSISIIHLEHFMQSIVDTTICENDPLPTIPPTDANGCNQIIIITVLQSPADVNHNYAICPGDSIMWNGQIYSTFGTYTIEQLDSGGCPYLEILTVSEYEDCITATKDFQSNLDLKLYPNPTNSYITLDGMDSTQEVKRVEIINKEGQLVLTFFTKDSQLKINTQELPIGIYVAKINSSISNSIRTVKFIKK